MKKKKTILTEADIEMLNSFQTANAGYFYQMLSYLHELIEKGVEDGRFTEEDAKSDCELANWYAYACNNIDDYEHYYEAMMWMPASEKNASGCGTWYYRYACALMYCGKLEKALEYAEKGVTEEPEYPWGWLQLARLRSYFGDETGAFAANDAGLQLVPGDYEFLRQEEELKKGYSLDMLEYHYIDETNDKDLLAGKVAEANEKLEAIAGLVCDQNNLKRIKDMLNPKEWEADCPYCSFKLTLQGEEVDGIFRMNEAALSKMDVTFLHNHLERIRQETDEERTLRAIFFNRDKTVDQLYENHKTGEMDYDRILISGERVTLEVNQNNGEDNPPPMIKLYKKEKDKIRYAECWPSGDLIIEHTGIVGDPGQIEQYPLADKAAYEEFLFSFQMNYGNLRYEEWDPAHGHWIVIQFPVSAMDLEHFNPAEEDVELREQVCSLLTEALGWNGAGEVDGWEFGKLFQDPQKYVLNIFCITIDVQIAQKIILETLTDNIDCSVMKLAVKEDGDDTYRLYYSADGSKEFSL